MERPNSDGGDRGGGGGRHQDPAAPNDAGQGVDGGPAPQLWGHEPTTDSDEFDVVERLRRRFRTVNAQTLLSAGARLEVAIGDDAAVIRLDDHRRMVVSVDVVVEGVHVDLALCSAADGGWKALMAAASDLAAMGAGPWFALASVVAPPGRDLDGFASGMAEAASRLGCPVVGGDLSAGSQLAVSVTVAGVVEEGRQPLLRSGASPGDTLLVTGPLGGSAAGLRCLQAGADAPESLARSYRRPVARIAEGETARRNGATAAIDLSDGLVADVRHLAAASGVGVDLHEVPTAEGATADEALGGGEDYELLLACDDPGRTAEAFVAAGLREPIVIGRCTAHVGRERLGDGPLPTGGWRHRL